MSLLTLPRRAPTMSPPRASTGARRRVLVVGWHAEARRALDALCGAGLEVDLVVSRSAAELVDARAATGLPCSQQATQALRAKPYDLALLADAARNVDDVAVAARQGAAVAILADGVAAEDLRAVGAIALQHSAPLFVLRPALHDPGVADLLALAANPAWRPRLLDVTVEGATDLPRLGSIAAALIVRLVDRTSDSVATTAHYGRMAASTITVGDCVVAARLRHAPGAFIRIAGDAEAGAFDLRIEDGVGRLAVTPRRRRPLDARVDRHRRLAGRGGSHRLGRRRRSRTHRSRDRPARLPPRHAPPRHTPHRGAPSRPAPDPHARRWPCLAPACRTAPRLTARPSPRRRRHTC